VVAAAIPDLEADLAPSHFREAPEAVASLPRVVVVAAASRWVAAAPAAAAIRFPSLEPDPDPDRPLEAPSAVLAAIAAKVVVRVSVLARPSYPCQRPRHLAAEAVGVRWAAGPTRLPKAHCFRAGSDRSN
jgi:hypothetical protein